MPATRTESVERAMSILLAFSSQNTTLSLAELARETGLHKSTILRLINSLQIYGFINKGQDGRYRVGASVWRLGLIFRQEFASRENVTPALRELVAATGETASFYVKAGMERVCLYRENSPNLVRFHVEEGMRLRLSTGASGLVLRHFSGEAVPDVRVFNANGTAHSVGETNPNISSVATPVFAAHGELTGALAVSGLISRFDDAARAAVVPLLERLAKSLAV